MIEFLHSYVILDNAGTSQDNWTRDGATKLVNAASLGIIASTPYPGGPTSSYVRDSQGTLLSETTPLGTYHYLYDGQGSVVALTDTTGHVAQTYAYDPYGNTTTSLGTVTNPWRYTAGYKDDQTGLYKYGARHYNPGLGQWTQPDPSGQDPNPYTYANGNPVNGSDPTGLDTCGEDWNIGGLVDCASNASDWVTDNPLQAAGDAAGCYLGAQDGMLFGSLIPGVGTVAGGVGGCIMGIGGVQWGSETLTGGGEI